MKMNFLRWSILPVATLLVFGCAPVISKSLRDQVDKNLTFSEVFKDPEAHKGSVVVWAGVIIDAKNTKEGTQLEILQKPADFFGAPEEVDRTGGRFLALYPSYLDVAVYSQGREVTVGGEVQGKRTLPLGQIEYTYPLVVAKEIYLWPNPSNEWLAPYPYPYPYYPYPGYPWWWYGPYWGPWYYPYGHYRFYPWH
jgi:outer membrane lipoprotein